MKRFPEAVRAPMQASGAMATCVPVRLDGADWEAALFFQLAGPECKADRRALAHAGAPLAVGLETDLIETGHAAVVVLRPEVHACADDPFACEILLTPGESGAHFDALELLTRQLRLCWFFADQSYRVFHSQAHLLDESQHAGFESLLADAVRHDAMIRLTGRYDSQAALGEIAARYELRAGVARAHRDADGTAHGS